MNKLIESIKLEIGFNYKPSCKNCCNHSTYEKDVNAPIIFTCEFAGQIKFEVDEDDSCQKWEEI